MSHRAKSCRAEERPPKPRPARAAAPQSRQPPPSPERPRPRPARPPRSRHSPRRRPARPAFSFAPFSFLRLPSSSLPFPGLLFPTSNCPSSSLRGVLGLESRPAARASPPLRLGSRGRGDSQSAPGCRESDPDGEGAS
ncbi:translation initiation factor IF-2-like [Cebus imitator]|uniref:translation initiation factor IF-2-like n=1 Tax=Cebus imitator TaxID=2715852 RepID=UPI00080A4509|nr:translation initiation factor IF-2-like [Cebus imitator]